MLFRSKIEMPHNDKQSQKGHISEFGYDTSILKIYRQIQNFIDSNRVIYIKFYCEIKEILLIIKYNDKKL